MGANPADSIVVKQLLVPDSDPYYGGQTVGQLYVFQTLAGKLVVTLRLECPWMALLWEKSTLAIEAKNTNGVLPTLSYKNNTKGGYWVLGRVEGRGYASVELAGGREGCLCVGV